jgi:hypothetical protein
MTPEEIVGICIAAILAASMAVYYNYKHKTA